MIQRIQSIYLIVVVVLTGILPLFIGLWPAQELDNNELLELLGSKNFIEVVLAVMFLAVAILALISLVLFHKRTLQLSINWVNIFINLILFSLLFFNLLNLSGEIKYSLKGIGIWLPLGSIVFLFLANRAIQKDENLVKSVDRIR